MAVGVWFGVLGPLRAEVGGRAARLGGPRQQAVLALLLIAEGRTVSAERILSEVWDGSRPPSMTTLHGYVGDLRRALEPEREPGAPARLLVREGSGYALRITPAAVDAGLFTDLAARGRRSLEGGEPEQATELLGQALALWRGPAYADFAGAAFAAPDATRLEDLRATVREDRLAAVIASGRHAAAVGELEALVAEQPLRERGWELLALALYRSGRQAEALATLRRVRRRLADELGIDPGRGLRELEAAVLAQEPALSPDSRPARGEPLAPETGVATAPAAPGRVPSPHRSAPAPPAGNLPFALSSFVGRGGDLAAVADLLDGHRLVTLTGPGGVGKTRLALEVARARTDADGPWLVELAGLRAPELLTATIATALGLPAASSPDQLAGMLVGRDLLIVVDNCEHLLVPAATVVHTLLSRCGAVRILCTSREPLGITGETVYEVPPLHAETEAAELFLRRAAATQAGWTPGPDDRERIAALCAGLDGIPLAIELAAAQCRTLSVGQIADALEDRFTLLVGGPAGRPDRHRTLLDTVAWSDQLLRPAERRLFHRLGVLCAGFDLEGAAAVGGVTPVLAPLSALVRKSLVTAEPGTAPRRYRMLETLRQYALGFLSPEELAGARERHRAWALSRAESAERHIRGPQGVALLDGLSRDQPEFRAAFASALAEGDGEHALRLGGALFWFWFRRGHVAEGLAWLSQAFAAAPTAGAGVRARARFAVGALRYVAGQTARAHEAARTAIEEAREAGDPVTEASATAYAGYLGLLAGAAVDAAALAGTAVELARRTTQVWLEAETLMVQGMVLRILGDLPGADAVFREAIAAAHASGHDWVADGAAWCDMKTASDRGDGPRALAIAGDILAAMDLYGDISFWLVTVHSAARALTLTGQAEQAALLMGAVEAIGRRAGVSPELMDPIDGPREAAAVRGALPPDEYERHAARGRALSREDASALLTNLIDGHRLPR
ncbi:winged helix-turn-helix domain-containing protein [Microbispora sp. RL4-1S]|uniref:Winged helix-turn-helix domain-containing protein n=1 Tax=Microbispora oryzae TaxID=2806554 RepID=A0A940WSR0_9ACTN|nr:BTAD domain-containing putative transcriptional regulator [Microbispora oryzae]MBP2706755.1 winged helix-turn-helix domain-containing protein [Microbispora oryzae]